MCYHTGLRRKSPDSTSAVLPSTYLSGRLRFCQLCAFLGVGALVASFVLTECPRGRGMWGIFGKPLKKAFWSTLGLHAVLATCLRISSVLDGACVACCPFLSAGSYHVCLQIHATCCCLPRCTTEAFGAEESSLWGCLVGAVNSEPSLVARPKRLVLRRPSNLHVLTKSRTFCPLLRPLLSQPSILGCVQVAGRCIQVVKQPHRPSAETCPCPQTRGCLPQWGPSPA